MKPRLILVIACLLSSSLPARGDGGAVRLSERLGAYQVTVFTSPAPLRVGPVDVSVLVQDPAHGVPRTDVDIHVEMRLLGPAAEVLSGRATTTAATNKLLHAALFDLPSAGRWRITVSLPSVGEQRQASCEVEVAPPLPRWATMWPWFAWPVIPIGLFVLYQWSQARRLRAHARGQ